MQKENSAIHSPWDADALRAAFGREGCPICTVVRDDIELQMDSWQYEGFTDVEHRHGLIHSRGFCPLHTWQLAQRNNAFQMALIYQEVLTNVVATVDRDQQKLGAGDHDRDTGESGQPPWWKRWRRRTVAGDVEPLFQLCPFCQMRARIEERLTQTLVEQLQSEEVRTLLKQSTGLCLLHFTMARQRVQLVYPQQLHYLLECQHICMQRALDEVRELIRKHDYRFEDEPQGDEMTSWRRAAELCAGNPGVR